MTRKRQVSDRSGGDSRAAAVVVRGGKDDARVLKIRPPHTPVFVFIARERIAHMADGPPRPLSQPPHPPKSALHGSTR